MGNMFNRPSDVADRVAADPINGKAMLRAEIAMGVYDKTSQKIAEDWLDDASNRDSVTRDALDRALEKELRVRAVDAAEMQATQAQKATRIASGALVVSLVGLFIAAVALLRS